MPVIHELPRHLADLIAAGEVVERPASVVKELMENSIDAGATKITVEIQHGGISYLRVTDNGCGMSAQDAPVAFRRHATSKLHTEEELGAIGTLGFRGEALAAIASVSRIDLFTKQAGTLAGSHLVVEGGEIQEQHEAGCPDGTSLIVRDLFFNTPARMKFLKKDFTEANYVLAAVQHAALSHPEIAFSLTRDGAKVFSSPGNGTLLSPVLSVYGRDATESMIEVPKYTKEQYTAWGYVGKPHAGRPNRSMQKFFVNGRFVRSKMMQAAVEEAYRNQIIHGKFPICVLFLELPLHMVDVNVHPAKTEVKFAQEKQIFDTIYTAVINALQTSDNTPVLHSSEKRSAKEDHLTQEQQQIVLSKPAKNVPPDQRNPDYLYDVNGIRDSIRKTTPEEITSLIEKTKKEFEAEEKNKPPVKPQQQGAAKEFELYDQFLAGLVRRYPTEEEIQALKSGKSPHTGLLRQQIDPIKTGSAQPHKLKPAAGYPAPPLIAPEQDLELPDLPKAEEPSLEAAQPESSHAPLVTTASERTAESSCSELFPTVRVIGEAFQTYVILEDDEGLLLLDKHAAHERLLFNRLKQTTEIEQQCLLAPVIVDLLANEFAAVRENIKQIQALGFELEEFGISSVAVRAIPSYLDAGDIAQTLSEIADKLLHNRVPTPDRLDDLIHTVACRAAIKAGKSTNPAELQQFCEKVLADPEIKCCPHGRPVTVRLTKYEIDKLFKRVNQ